MQRLKQIFRFFLVLVLACSFAFAYFKYKDLLNRYYEVKQAEADFEKFVQQIRDLVEQKKQLEQEIERLKADQLKQEESVRRAKGWVYPGENVIRLEER